MTYATLNVEPQVGDLVANRHYTTIGLVVAVDNLSVWCNLVRYDTNPLWIGGEPVEYPKKHFKLNYHPQPTDYKRKED